MDGSRATGGYGIQVGNIVETEIKNDNNVNNGVGIGQKHTVGRGMTRDFDIVTRGSTYGLAHFD